MNSLQISFIICLSLALVTGQLFGPQFGNGGRFDGLSAFSGDFGGPTAFAGNVQTRDPRQNRGPVVFPPSPPDAVDETSGVIVGASGYGFVPAQNQLQRNFAPGLPASVDGFDSRYFQQYTYF